MSCRFFSRARRSLVRVAASSDGVIVLGLLIVIVGMVVTGVLIGKVVHASRYPYEVPLGERELRHSTVPVEVRYGALVTRRIAPDEAIWVRSLEGDRLAVFEAEGSARVIGFVSERALPYRGVPATPAEKVTKPQRHPLR
jgi:hypothetical protein